MGLKLGTVIVLLSAWAGSAWAVDAQALFEKKCKMCHSIAGVGGKKMDLGGPLERVAGKRDEAWLKAYLTAPKSKIENSKKPKLKLSTEELDAIVAFLLALK